MKGSWTAIVAPEAADGIVAAMRGHGAPEPNVSGTVGPQHAHIVSMKTAFSSTRIVDLLAGDQLPRIC
jgi:hydrogenase expression/formation protein HypE